MRREFSAKVRMAAYDRANGNCESCGIHIRHSAHYDHRIADAVGGEPTLENCQLLCKACHAQKTFRDDVPTIAKSKRVRQKHILDRGRRNRSFRGWRRFDGSPVWRDNDG
jgi:5-methylcytosine-specific restriction protein A